MEYEKRPCVYQGKNPYVFVSYSRKDSEKVDIIIENLNKKGVRIWYDNGIRPAAEWSKTIVDRINQASYFIAPESVKSIPIFGQQKREQFLQLKSAA